MASLRDNQAAALPRRKLMRAIIYTRYGTPDVLQLKDVATPSPKPHEILIKVHAASINPADSHFVRGAPFLFRPAFGGMRRPKYTIPGADIAGRVEAVGKDVTQFQPGDAVFGDLSFSGRGTLAEYVCVSEDAALALKPGGTTFEAAAAVPMAAITALQGLRDKGQIQPGHKVLINGASGGVGTFAVQIAKAFAAEVTGVCSSRNVAMVRSIGADRVIDYTREDATVTGERYDLILDCAAYRSFLAYRRALSPEGIYVSVGGSVARSLQAVIVGPVISLAGRRKLGGFMARANKKDLVVLKELLESGKVVPIIDRCYPLGEAAAALRYLEGGHARGKVVITVAQSNAS